MTSTSFARRQAMENEVYLCLSLLRSYSAIVTNCRALFPFSSAEEPPLQQEERAQMGTCFPYDIFQSERIYGVLPAETYCPPP